MREKLNRNVGLQTTMCNESESKADSEYGAEKKLYKDSTRCQFNVLLKSTRNNNIHFSFIK